MFLLVVSGCSSASQQIDWHLQEMPSRMLGSFLFLILMFITFKPKLWIVGKISKCPLHDKNPDGSENREAMFWFKIININSFFKCHDLRFSLFILEPHYSGGKNIMIDSIELKRTDLPFLRSLTSGIRNTAHDEFACRIRTSENLEELLGRTKSLRLQVVAKHQLSGLTSYFTRDFDIDDIEEGRFKSGLSGRVLKKSR